MTLELILGFDIKFLWVASRLYQEGESVRDIASKAGVSHMTIWKKIKRSGVTLRSKVEALKQSGPRSEAGHLRLYSAKLLEEYFNRDELKLIFRESDEWLDRALAMHLEGR